MCVRLHRLHAAPAGARGGVINCHEALEKLLGPGEHRLSESDMHSHVLSAGESMTILTPRDSENNPLNFDRSNPLWVKINEAHARVAVEICYCSTPRRMLDLAQRVDQQRDCRDRSLPESFGN